MNVYQKINEVKKVIKAFVKDDQTSGKGAYAYVSGTQILAAIKNKMEEIGLLLLPVKTEHRSWTTFNYKNSYKEEKTDFIVDGKIFYEWINIDDPADRQIVSLEFYGQQNDISKAFGSALTYSERYLLLKSLGAPTDEDDPDKKNENKTQNKENANVQPPEKDVTKQPEKQEKPKNSDLLSDLIKDTAVTADEIRDYCKNNFNSRKVNELSDIEFTKLFESIKSVISPTV